MSDPGCITTTTSSEIGRSSESAQHRTADDTTVPTDLTVSSEGGGRGRSSPGAVPAPAPRARLMHELQLLRVELAELTHQRQVERREQQDRVDELEEQLAEAQHQRNMLQIRQTGQLGQYEAELSSLRQQLEQLLGRQRQLEEDNSRLQVTPDQLKRSLTHLTVSESRYQQLSKMDAETMSLIDFAALRLHEAVVPLQGRCRQLEAELELARPQLAALQAELADTRRQAERARQEQLAALRRLSEAHQRLGQSALPRAERDRLAARLARAEAEREAALTALADTERRLEAAQQAQTQLRLARERVSALESEQLCWAGRLAEAAARRTEAEEEAARQQVRADQQAEAERAARTQYAALRDSARAQHQREVAELMAERSAELARGQQREQQARQAAQQTAERLESELAAERTRLAELTARLQVAQYELERHELTARQAAEAADSLRRHNSQLTGRLQDQETAARRQQSESEQERARLERETADCRRQLAAYEAFESSWDAFITQAAQGGDGCTDLLESAPALPAGCRRRLQYSLQLGRRLVDSESARVRLRTQLKQQAERAERLQQQLGRLEPLLAGGPASAPDWRHHEHTIDRLQTDSRQLTEQLQRLRRQLAAVTRQRDKLVTDMEVLLRQEDELAALKLLVTPLLDSDSVSRSDQDSGETAS